MIIVTGATGKLGARIVDRLLARVPAGEVGVSVRDPGKAVHLTERGVSVRHGDFADPQTLPEAFADARQVLVVSPDAGFGEEERILNRAAITAAAAAGASRAIYTSHMGADANPDSLFAAIPDHAAAEQVLAGAGVPFTALRNGFYAATVPFLVRQATQTGQLVAPADGPMSWTTHDDLAEATAIVLADEGRLDGATPALTAAEALDLADSAAILSELTGRSIERVTIGDEDWVAGPAENGLSQQRAQNLLGVFLASRRGDFSAVDPTLEELLGRRPRSVRQVLAENLSADR